MYAIPNDLTKEKIKALGTQLCKSVLVITSDYIGIHKILIPWEILDKIRFLQESSNDILRIYLYTKGNFIIIFVSISLLISV